MPLRKLMLQILDKEREEIIELVANSWGISLKKQKENIVEAIKKRKGQLKEEL